MSDVQKLHLLEQDQKLFGQVRPETLVVEISNNLTLALNVTFSQENVAL
ncbi:hypothetical protein [Mesorhizobium sp. WSM3868]|nr:hypothetical protein [Mesorhizobium sp. WSM3868]